MKLIRSWTFLWWEIGLIKMCLLSLGMLLGIYFTDYLAPLRSLWWALFAGTTIYFLLKFVRDVKEPASPEHAQ